VRDATSSGTSAASQRARSAAAKPAASAEAATTAAVAARTSSPSGVSPPQRRIPPRRPVPRHDCPAGQHDPLGPRPHRAVGDVRARHRDPVRHERHPRRRQRDHEAAEVEVRRARRRAAHDARAGARAQALQDGRRDDLGDHGGRR
jgi:hypothetical protein